MSVDGEQLSAFLPFVKKKKDLRKFLQNAEEGVSALSIREYMYMCVREKLCYSCCCCHVVVGLLKFSGF